MTAPSLCPCGAHRERHDLEVVHMNRIANVKIGESTIGLDAPLSLPAEWERANLSGRATPADAHRLWNAVAVGHVGHGLKPPAFDLVCDGVPMGSAVVTSATLTGDGARDGGTWTGIDVKIIRVMMPKANAGKAGA